MGLRRRIATTAAATIAATGVAVGLAAPATALEGKEPADFLAKLTATYNDPAGPANPKDTPYDFDIVTKAVLFTEADKTLLGLNAFTLFAPNDRAFEVLAKDLGLLGKNYRFSAKVDEKLVWEKLSTIPNAKATITNILLYHVIPDAKITGKTVLSGPFTQRVTMANQQSLRITVLSRNASFPVIVLGDRDGKFFNDLVVRSKIDAVDTPNTVVHGISDVLLP